MLLQALLKGGRCGDELPLSRGKLMPVLSQAMWLPEFSTLGCHCRSQAPGKFPGRNVRAWRLFGGWGTNHLGKAPIFPFCGCPPSYKPQQWAVWRARTDEWWRGEEGGARRQQALCLGLCSRMGQRQAGSAGFPTLLQGPISSKILPLLWPGVMWVSYLAFEIPGCRSEPQHTTGFFSVCVLENTLSGGGSAWAAWGLTQCTGLRLDRYLHNKKSWSLTVCLLRGAEHQQIQHDKWELRKLGNSENQILNSSSFPHSIKSKYVQTDASATLPDQRQLPSSHLCHALARFAGNDSS